MKPLVLKEISIIDAFPVYNCGKTVLDVGCGPGVMDFHLARMGYRVYGVDIVRYDEWEDSENLTFHIGDIFDLSTIPIRSADIIICSQVLEHLGAYGIALINMMALANTRIVITIPYRRSFAHQPDHLHFWADERNRKFEDVNEFKRFCHPNSVAISKIRTKPEDAGTKEQCYLITIDKRQCLMIEEQARRIRGD